jgi:hypothetical protein
MILGVYKRNSKKEKWAIHSLALSAEEAKKASRKIKRRAKKIGLIGVETGIQAFGSAADVKSILETIEEEKKIYN